MGIDLFVTNEQDVGVREQVELLRTQAAEPEDCEPGGSFADCHCRLDGSIGCGSIFFERRKHVAQLKQITRSGPQHAPAIVLPQKRLGLGAIRRRKRQVGNQRVDRRGSRLCGSARCDGQ